MIIEDQKLHCIHGFITNQETKAFNNNNIRTGLSNTLMDSLQFE